MQKSRTNGDELEVTWLRLGHLYDARRSHCTGRLRDAGRSARHKHTADGLKSVWQYIPTMCALKRKGRLAPLLKLALHLLVR